MPATIAENLAAEALEFRYEALPASVIKQAKHLVLNALGSGFMGHEVEPSQIIENLASEMVGPPEATVFFSGFKTSCLFAALANVAKVANTGHWDKCYLTPDASMALGPNRQLIPALMSVGERQHKSGRDVLTAIVAAYELSNKIMGALGGNRGLAENGWGADTIGRPCALALTAGRLLGLNQEHLANALGIAGTFGLSPRVVTSPTTKYHLRSPMPAINGLLAALLAWQGYPGPHDVFEGAGGLASTAMRGNVDLDSLRQPRKDWSILYTGINRTSVDGDIVGMVEAALTLVKQHDLKPGDIERVVLRGNPFEVGRQGDPNDPHLRAPKTREVALHSLYYAGAVAITDRAMGFEQYLEERFLNPDPVVQEVINRISVVPDAKYEGVNQSGSAEITTRSGTKLSCEVLYPRGLHPKNLMNDEEHEENFRGMAGRVIGEAQMQDVIASVYDFDKFDDIESLIRKLTISTSAN
jgi:2-methylcitrate dehydratase